jgi:enoyl-CoA hydratase/carnithine racemase
MATNPAERIQSDVSEGICTITFNRPEKKNAFTVSMYEAIIASLKGAEANPAVRVIVLTGAGDAFTGGNDLADFMNNPPNSDDHPVVQLLMRLVDAEKPVIAAVNGIAVGIGTTMLLHCDLVYASDKARFLLPFVNLGLVPEGASTYLMPRMVGHQRAAELLFLGEQFDAATAKEVGIVNRVLEAQHLTSFVRERALALCEKPRTALRRTKRLMKDPRRDEVTRAIKREGELFIQCLESPEAREAFTAFFEKRKPNFKSI